MIARHFFPTERRALSAALKTLNVIGRWILWTGTRRIFLTVF